MLNNTFFSKFEFDEALKQFENRVERMQEHQQEVCETIHTKFNSIEDVERFTIENIKADMDKVLEDERARYKNVLFSDAQRLLDVEERYSRMLREFTPVIRAFQNDVEFYRTNSISLKLDSHGKIWADEKDMKKAATDKATHSWTDEDKKLYTKLGELVELISEIRGIHKQNYNYILKWHLTDRDVPKYAEYGQLLGEIRGLSITPEKFYNMKRAKFGSEWGVYGVAVEDAIV